MRKHLDRLLRCIILTSFALVCGSIAHGQSTTTCPSGLIGVNLAHPADESTAMTFCVASVVPAKVESGKPVSCLNDLVLVTLASSPTSFACVSRSTVPAQQRPESSSSTSPPSTSSSANGLTQSETTTPAKQATDCSQLKNKFLQAMCAVSQGVNQGQNSSAAANSGNGVSAQDILNGSVPCNDPRILDDPGNDVQREKMFPGVHRKDANFILCVSLRILKGDRVAMPVGLGSTWKLAVVHSTQINSMLATQPNGQMVVEAFDSMASFVNYDPDEEAFIIGHEIGHVQDVAHCAYLHGQASQAVLFQSLAQKHAQQACEQDADFYGLQYMWGAGFNPYAAGALMGRLEMYLPDQARGLNSMLNNFLSDHPISSERTKKLRDEMIQLCSKPGTVCQAR